MPRVLVTDPIADDGIDILRREAEVDIHLKPTAGELIAIVPEYDALIVRSETKVTAEVIAAGEDLKVIGRAGSGVDNIDIDAATQRGVVVVNAPVGNIISAAEHTITLMLGLSRHLAEGHETLRAGRWERQRLMGVEVRGKTLGLIGLGQVGSEVARRARGLEMRVIAHDPYVSADRAQSLGVELLPLEDVMRQSDYLSLHLRLTPQTNDLLNDDTFAKLKPGVRIINAARGELINEAALIRALDDGRVAGAAIDVFRQEPPGENPLLHHDRILVTPHLGALTEEAQERVAVDVAQEVLAVLRGEPARYAVNAPLVSPEMMEALRPYLDVAERAASLATQISEGQIRELEIDYLGDIADLDTRPLRAAVIKGLLAPVSDENVTIVNANLIAEHRGLDIQERTGRSDEFANLLSVHVHTDRGETTVAGSAFHDGAHIERIGDFWVDIPPGEGYLLLCENVDRPGMIGAVGTLLGEHRVNIKLMHVSPPVTEGGLAMMVLRVAGEIPPDVLHAVEQLPDIYSARLAKI